VPSRTWQLALVLSVTLSQRATRTCPNATQTRDGLDDLIIERPVTIGCRGRNGRPMAGGAPEAGPSRLVTTVKTERAFPGSMTDYAEARRLIPRLADGRMLRTLRVMRASRRCCCRYRSGIMSGRTARSGSSMRPWKTSIWDRPASSGRNQKRRAPRLSSDRHASTAGRHATTDASMYCCGVRAGRSTTSAPTACIASWGCSCAARPQAQR
jgi:hypothetical protein